MFITVASYNGGVGKTTTAVHLAAYLQTLAQRDKMGQRGGFPFQIADEKEGAYQASRLSPLHSIRMC
jgi:chromosome partitioning protein